MDFVKLVEDGRYTKEELTEKQRTYIDAMEYVKDEFLDSFEAYMEDENVSPTLTKIIHEIRADLIENLRAYLYSDICEHIVCFGDANYIEEENKAAAEED